MAYAIRQVNATGGFVNDLSGYVNDVTVAEEAATEEAATGGWYTPPRETARERDERVRRERERLGIIEPRAEPGKVKTPLVAKASLASQEIDALAAFLEQMEAQDDLNAMKRRRAVLLLLTL